jgi:hypothetical protein
MDINYPLEYWQNFSGPFPQMVFADRTSGVFALGVKLKTKGIYGHFCWLIGPDELASQWVWFRREKLDHYKGCYLKFVHNPSWTDLDRIKMLAAIKNDLALPWYKTLYDVPGIVGELFGLDWFNLPGADFCSERGKYLALVDQQYNLVHPDPTELNLWTKNSGRFEVSGRYTPD